MFVCKTKTRTGKEGQNYDTYRLVRSYRDNHRVRQKTLLNLGSDFEIESKQWPLLCSKVVELLQGSQPLIPLKCSPEVEHKAKYLYAQLVERQATRIEEIAGEDPLDQGEFQAVDLDNASLILSRSVGVEHVALWAIETLGLRAILRRHGLREIQCHAILGSVIGRMAAPGSERHTNRWLRESSALGELLKRDFETMGHSQLYRASDALISRQEKIESDWYHGLQTIFDLKPTITLYDLTNTYFEGQARKIPEAQRGRSKEKRSDGPLLTLALVRDSRGWVRRSKVFAGNVSENQTLAAMLESLAVPAEATVIMDCGIATEANLRWLRERGTRYLTVSRQQERIFDPEGATEVETASGPSVYLRKEVQENGEVFLYCHSEQREEKERAMQESSDQKFTAQLERLQAGLSRPRRIKRRDKVHQKIGRLKQQYSAAGQHYDIQVIPDDQNPQNAKSITWNHHPKPGSKATHPGVYCLRTNQDQWDESTLWKTYITLTDLEAVFRSLKSELGLRPSYHQTSRRAKGHLFLSVLAYQLVQTIRTRLRAKGITDSWNTIRDTLNDHKRVTGVYRRIDGTTVHVRRAVSAEPKQREIYEALGIDSAPGGVRKSKA